MASHALRRLHSQDSGADLRLCIITNPLTEPDQYRKVFGLYLERPRETRMYCYAEIRYGRFRYSDLKEAARAAEAYVV